MSEVVSLEPELRISPRAPLVALLLLGLLLSLGAEFFYPYAVVERVISLFLVACVLVAAGLVLTDWRPVAARWYTVLVLAVAVHVSSLWLGLPEALALVAVPVSVAALLISVPAAALAALAETAVLLVLLSRPDAASSAIGVALLSCWVMLGTMHAAYAPVRRLGQWVETYFEQAQRLLEQARDRKADLEQALQQAAHANRQLALASERTAALRTIAEEAQRAKTTFVASVSHEFRTPLNMIIGLVDLMIHTPEMYDVILSPDMRDDLRVVHRNCVHLSNMINDVLDLTRMEAGAFTLHRERVALGDVIARGIAVIRPLLEKKRLALRVVVPNDLPLAFCDRTRIQQVILNLVSNATRFTEQGSVTVEVTPQDGRLLVAVRDTGPGIPPEDAERIFEPFWQGSRQLWRDQGGSGLGLSISHRFVQLHGGQMWVESEMGTGTSFFFTVPVSPPIEHLARPGHQTMSDWVWKEQAFRTGQVIGAEELVRPRLIIYDKTRLLHACFARHYDQAEFIEVLDLDQLMREAQECPAHAVLLNAPSHEDLRSLLETVAGRLPDTPVMVFSVSQEARFAAEAGALGHLIKPVTRADLMRAIDTVGRPVRCVLVVDDDSDVLNLFTRMLRICDPSIEVVTAQGGEQALVELRRRQVNLLLLDIVMPGMNGWEVLETMRQDGEIGEVPTFIVSAQDPAGKPPTSEFIVASIGGGISLNKLLRCSLEMSALLLAPEIGPDLGPL